MDFYLFLLAQKCNSLQKKLIQVKLVKCLILIHIGLKAKTIYRSVIDVFKT